VPHSDGKVQFGPVLGLFLLNPEPDLGFGSANTVEPQTEPLVLVLARSGSGSGLLEPRTEPS
jgi:hypothetical protein